jgi:hypothetical protein
MSSFHCLCHTEVSVKSFVTFCTRFYWFWASAFVQCWCWFSFWVFTLCGCFTGTWCLHLSGLYIQNTNHPTPTLKSAVLPTSTQCKGPRAEPICLFVLASSNCGVRWLTVHSVYSQRLSTSEGCIHWLSLDDKCHT